MNKLLRSTSHPLSRALGEVLEGSSLAEKQDMRLPLPHHQPQQAGGSPGEGRQPLLPFTPTPSARLPRGQDGVSCLARQGGPVSGSVRVPGNDIALKRVWVGRQQEEILQGVSGLPQTP